MPPFCSSTPQEIQPPSVTRRATPPGGKVASNDERSTRNPDRSSGNEPTDATLLRLSTLAGSRTKNQSFDPGRLGEDRATAQTARVPILVQCFPAPHRSTVGKATHPGSRGSTYPRPTGSPLGRLPGGRLIEPSSWPPLPWSTPAPTFTNVGMPSRNWI